MTINAKTARALTQANQVGDDTVWDAISRTATNGDSTVLFYIGDFYRKQEDALRAELEANGFIVHLVDQSLNFEISW